MTQPEGSDRQRCIDSRCICASERESRAYELATRQHHLLTSPQIAAAGFSRGALQHRVASGRWTRVHSGVFSVTQPPITEDARLLAAVLACGEGSAAAVMASAWAFDLAPNLPDRIDVVNAGGRGRSRSGIRVHRWSIESFDLTLHRRIRCCTPTRTIADLSSVLDERRLEEILMKASSRGLLREPRLRELAEEPGRRGALRLRRLLGLEVSRMRSGVELDLRRICGSIGIEPPMVNGLITAGGRSFEVDFHWPDVRLIIEVDGYAFHGGRSRANADRDRDQVLALAGWVVHRFTRDQIVDDPGKVGRRIRALLLARRRSLAAMHR